MPTPTPPLSCQLPNSVGKFTFKFHWVGSKRFWAPKRTRQLKRTVFRLTNEDSNHSSSHHDKGSILMSKEMDVAEVEGKKINKLGKCRSRISSKMDSALEFGVDADGDQSGLGTSSSSREEKVSSLKTVSSSFHYSHGPFNSHFVLFNSVCDCRAWYMLQGRCPKMLMLISCLVLCTRDWANL